MTLEKIKEEIVSNLKPFPSLTTIPELSEKIEVAYNTIYRYLMELVAEQKVGYIKKGTIKLYFAPLNTPNQRQLSLTNA